MKIQSLPAEVLVEILHYLADYERLAGLGEILDQEITVDDVRASLRELAVQIQKAIDQKKLDGPTPVSGRLAHVSPSVKQVLSRLSPREEKTLLGLFGLLGE